MKKTAAAASALALGALTTPAHADAPADTHDWSGFYVGAGVGPGSVTADWEIDGGEGAVSDEDGPAKGNENGATGGIQAGYNHQIGGLVIGGEADFSIANFEEHTRFDGGEGAELRTKIHGLGTVRGRLGWALDDVLCFVTGGLAVGDLKSTYNSDGSPSTKEVRTDVGWVAGGGVELAVSERVSVFAEALFASFDDGDTARGPSYDDDFDVETDFTLGRFGINVAF
jgi:outer membrane immunogenic protein